MRILLEKNNCLLGQSEYSISKQCDAYSFSPAFVIAPKERDAFNVVGYYESHLYELLKQVLREA